MALAALLLGTNLGSRIDNLTHAREAIAAKAGHIMKASALYSTAPWGNTDQPDFINQALLIETKLAPEELIQKLLSIEKEMGRERLEKWGARLIDIDILLIDDIVVNEPQLKIPHPLMQERRFTLVALAEILPEWEHPLLHKNIQNLLLHCPDHSTVREYSV